MNVKLKDKDESKAVKWIQSQASTDQAREILTGIWIKNGYTYSADGYVLGRIPTPETLKEFEGKVIKPLNTLTVNPRLEEWEEVVGTYPQVEQIIENDREEVISFTLSKKKLAKMVKDMPGDDSDMVTLTITTDKHPLVIETDQAYGLIMPMHKGN